jgi:hypothetical protein
MTREHWWRAASATPRNTGGQADQSAPTYIATRPTSALTNTELNRVIGGVDGPPGSIGGGNGVTGGKASPQLF